MKRRVLIILLSVVLLCVLACAGLWIWFGYSDQLAHQRAQALAQQVADALGRTPANQIVDYKLCGGLFISCGYHVYFAFPEGFAGMDARVRAMSKLNLRVGLADEFDSGNPLLDINGDLNMVQIRGRLTVTSTSPYREPVFSYWILQNEQGETVGRIWLYHTRDTGVSYLFDGKPLPNSNIVHVFTLVYSEGR
jgi:hypothetical protein